MPSAEKISITIGQGELESAKKLASRLGLSLSSLITEAVREHVEEHDRRRAGQAVLATFGARDRASPEEMRELLERWSAPPAPAKPAKKRAAARAKKARSAKPR